MDLDDFDDFLAPLSTDRAEAVKAWPDSPLKSCVTCAQPIRVMDSHRLIKAGLVHTRCASADG